MIGKTLILLDYRAPVDTNSPFQKILVLLINSCYNSGVCGSLWLSGAECGLSEQIAHTLGQKVEQIGDLLQSLEADRILAYDALVKG